MLAGHPPFAGKNVPKVVYQVTHDDPPKLAGVSPAVQAVLKRALAKKPDERYPSARALADAYRAASLGQAGQAAPPAPVPPLPRRPRPPVVLSAPPRRRQAVPRPILWASGLLLLVLLAALPQVLHPRIASAPRVVVLQRPRSRTVSEWHPANPKHETPPVVRVASARQERRVHPVHPAPAPLRSRLVSQRLAQDRGRTAA